MQAAKPTASIATRQPSRPRSRHQIPIGPAARLSGLSRSDFLPWRFSDAGRRNAGTTVPPASEKPAQTQTWEIHWHHQPLRDNVCYGASLRHRGRVKRDGVVIEVAILAGHQLFVGAGFSKNDIDQLNFKRPG